MSPDKLPYARPSSEWPAGDRDSLKALLECAVPVRRETFRLAVDETERRRLELALGYSAHPRTGTVMAADAGVRYYRSVLRGKRCYFFEHRDIAHVFAKEGSQHG